MDLKTGTHIGPYEILGPLGTGGMGEVYRARDTRLGRDVAIKISKDKFSERFEREARTIASLNHPNICHLYDVGPNYLVMELIEGPTLRERLRDGALTEAQAIDTAIQITDALQAAHEKDIVHRDLKPGNVKLKPDGSVKVLDFGLAKVGRAASTSGSPPDPELSPTISMAAATEVGVILGTAGYMSPEQAKGKPVDKRADIWAFGVVLFEMLTGKRLFKGEDGTETLAAVIRDEPDYSLIPMRLRPLTQMCLRKDPNRRLHDIADARLILEQLRDAAPEAIPSAVVPSKNIWWVQAASRAWIAAGVLAISAASLALVHFREKPTVAQPLRLQIPVPEGMAFNAGTFAISPDGRRAAFGAGTTDGNRRFWIRELDSLELKPLPGTEIPAVTQPPFWSPDSRVLAFSADGKLKKVNISGGPPQIICELGGGGAQGFTASGGGWNLDGTIVFGSNTGALRRCPASGGPASPVTVLAKGENAHRWPQFLPDGRHFLYTRTSNAPEKTGVFVGSVDAKPEEQDLKPLLITDRQAYYVAPGWLLFAREDALMAQPFDPAKLVLSGEAMPIANPLGSFINARYSFFNVSTTGVILYRGGAGGLYQLTWLDADGKRSTIGEPSLWGRPAVSPDGTRVAASAGLQGNSDIWVLDTARGTSTRLTFDPGVDDAAVWSPDGARITFRSDRSGHADLYVKASDGSGDDQVLLKTDQEKIPESWSRDGKYLIYSAIDPGGGGSDLWVLPLDGERKPFPFLKTQFSEYAGRFSPDTRWIAYVSNESGTPEIYVRPFARDSAGSSASGGKWMVSRGGGGSPHWRADGKRLFYRNPSGTIMAVDVTADKSFQAGVPVRMFESGFGGGPFAYEGMTPDGKRFIFPLPQGAAAIPTPFTVLLNWQAGLKR